jgi:hypothetical protein
VNRAGSSAPNGETVMTTTSSFSLSTVRSEFTANSFPLGSQMLPDVQHLSNGGFVVAYNSQIGSDGSILLDFYDSNAQRINGTPLATYDALATTSASGQPSMTQLANGNVLVAWDNNDPANLGIKAVMFTPGGEKVGPEITLISGENSSPHVAALSDGKFALTLRAPEPYLRDRSQYRRSCLGGIREPRSRARRHSLRSDLHGAGER